MGEEEENGAAEEVVVKYRGWKAMPYIVGNETFEKLGTLGASSNLLVYFTTVFNMQSVTATTIVNVWNGTTNMATIFGAILSDAYFGRFATLGFACVASFLGMVVIALTAAIPALHPDHCNSRESCQGPTPWQLAFLISGLGFMVVGGGGIRPCNLAFGADQFDPKIDAGKRGINSFFNWYFFTYTTAMVFSATVIVYVQSNVSWAVGLAIPAGLMFLSCAFFLLGTPIYVRVRPEGSPFASVVRVAVAAFRKRRLRLPEGCPSAALFNPPELGGGINTRLAHTDQFSFLDKAAIVTCKDEVDPNELATNLWRLCSLQQIEEVKCLVRVIPIWSTAIIYYVGSVQQSTYAILEALQSNRYLGNTNFVIPAASFSMFSMLAVTIWIPIYDRIIVPWLRRITRKEEGITLLQRMGVGIILSILATITSAIVEERRRRIALHYPTIGVAKNGGAISSMSSLWLILQLSISGLSEAFNIIGQVEFYYKQFPENMRSVAGSFFFCGMAISNYLSGLLVIVVHRATNKGGEDGWLADDLNHGKLDYFYFLVAALGVVNFFYFLICASWYRYKGSDVVNDSALETNSPTI